MDPRIVPVVVMILALAVVMVCALIIQAFGKEHRTTQWIVVAVGVGTMLIVLWVIAGPNLISLLKGGQ